MGAKAANSTSFKKGNPGGKPGRRARKTIFREYVQLVAGAEGIDPKAFMLGIVGDDEMPTEVRLMAAREVIPYTHKRMPQAIDLDATVKIKSGFAQAVAAASGVTAPEEPQE